MVSLNSCSYVRDTLHSWSQSRDFEQGSTCSNSIAHFKVWLNQPFSRSNHFHIFPPWVGRHKPLGGRPAVGRLAEALLALERLQVPLPRRLQQVGGWISLRDLQHVNWWSLIIWLATIFTTQIKMMKTKGHPAVIKYGNGKLTIYH